MKVIPFGYAHPGSEALLHSLMMQDEKTLLVDIRRMPYCNWNKGKNAWQQKALQEKYEARYHFAGFYLGNLNYKTGGPIKIAHPDAGIRGLKMYLEDGYTLILLCGCQDYATCHRRVVCELLQAELPTLDIVQSDALVVPNTIKMLSIRQLYASWLANPQWFRDAGLPVKCIENRKWTTSYRGLLLLHASATIETEALSYWARRIPGIQDVVPRMKSEYPTKSIVGIAQLTDVVTESSDPWFCDKYGFVLENARPIEPPIPYHRGALGLFGVPVSVLQEHGVVVG